MKKLGVMWRSHKIMPEACVLIISAGGGRQGARRAAATERDEGRWGVGQQES